MNGLFLRDVTLPNVVAHGEGESPPREDKLHSSHIAVDFAESESDNEKFVTEAMRDERLA